MDLLFSPNVTLVGEFCVSLGNFWVYLCIYLGKLGEFTAWKGDMLILSKFMEFDGYNFDIDISCFLDKLDLLQNFT